jgi:hypothetical protein
MAASYLTRAQPVEAFGTADDFADALCKVAPPIKRQRRIRVWRGVKVRDASPADAAIGLSWTRNRDIACWFATRREVTGVRAFVFETVLEPEQIIVFYNGRREQEVIVNLARFELGDVWVEGTNLYAIELDVDDAPPGTALADWRIEAGAPVAISPVADAALRRLAKCLYEAMERLDPK